MLQTRCPKNHKFGIYSILNTVYSVAYNYKQNTPQYTQSESEKKYQNV